MLSLTRHVGEEIPLATEAGLVGVLRVVAVVESAVLLSFQVGKDGAVTEYPCRPGKDTEITGPQGPLGSVRITGIMADKTPPKARIGFDFPKDVLIDRW